MDTLKKIGKYKYGQRHCLGEGSFGKVYEGLDELGRKVAIKKIEQKMIATDPYLKSSLNTEISIMKKLKNKNIVQLIDTVITTNSIYLILQFCQNGDLKRYSMGKRFTEDEALEILKQLIDGFSVIVKEGIIHRDLKPANVLVHEGTFKICDFGFAKYFGELNRMTKTCVGTPIYMSPQVLKHKPYTSKSDIWSLGAMYYEILFGKLPFLGKSEDEIFKIITRGKLVIPKCSDQSFLFIKNALVIDQQQRWSWKDVFDHFGIKENKEKPTFYQNFVNFFQTKNDQNQGKNSVPQIQTDNLQKKNLKILNRNELRYQVERDSLEKLEGNQAKGKHVKAAKNSFALLEQKENSVQCTQLGPSSHLSKQQYLNQIVNHQRDSYEQTVANQEQKKIQKCRWLYNTTIKFMFNLQFYSDKIPSFKKFIYRLLKDSLDSYGDLVNLPTIKQNKIKRLVLEQQKQSLSKVIKQISIFEPCQNLNSLASVISLEGCGFLSSQEAILINQLQNFKKEQTSNQFQLY